MIKRLFFLVLLFGLFKNTHAQYGTERIEMKQQWNGYIFTVDEKKVSQAQALQMIQLVDTVAFAKMKKSRTNKNWAALLGALGGVAIGYPLGEILAGANPKWQLGLAGAVLAGISIPINNKARKQATDALDLYNSKVTSSPQRRKVEYHMVYSGTGVGIKLNWR